MYSDLEKYADIINEAFENDPFYDIWEDYEYDIREGLREVDEEFAAKNQK
jgi:hypothetical protein